jgi:isopenicillin N synthase-like dioxygenase
MSYAEAKQFDPADIPVVDISSLRDSSDPITVSKALHAASESLGFIYIKGHGIPDSLIQAARQCAMDFFNADGSAKSAVTVSAQHRGWLGRGSAKMQDDAKPDLKESFIWGYQDASGNTPEDHPLRGANQWPASVPQMQTVAMDYFQQAHEVAFHLMRGFALGLQLDEGFFLKTCKRPLSRASFVYYPSQPESLGEEQFGVGPHTDFGVLTVLCQDNIGGLQVQNIGGEWVQAPPIEGTLLVNVGDLLSRWTDGAYKSTPHRVVNSSGQERLSLVLAFDPDPETPIDAREIFGSSYQAKEAPINCGDYLIWRFAKAFSYRK